VVPTQISSIRRLPTMSASRPTIGTATAAVSRVAVTIHAVSAAGAPSRRGNCGTSGTTSVCCSETVMPTSASTGTKVDARRGAGGPDTSAI
jgi:hypothetical protein